eukprot:CAMPEP_0182932510 /NCGR_PEP_ID=MMETSP0105_2-20130417/31500_1 /TAXON_ID=81532 ORGANISM="Acanthoeca-like sp., Strain 10tr" /NCGR_SAMPLE_ID=MMETSP0105_2 /ASSEMBLY_ACC=CAM_ASM_000205 /LENGTH=231 /DNA_ID=CAMNT_0025071115 /DNA_START=160 /DNA_END=855 /DNA_ORIENTATION=+
MMLASIPEAADIFQPAGFGPMAMRRGSLRGELFGLYVDSASGSDSAFPASDKVPSLIDEALWLSAMDHNPPSCVDDTSHVPASPPYVLHDEADEGNCVVPDVAHSGHAVVDIDTILTATTPLPTKPKATRAEPQSAPKKRRATPPKSPKKKSAGSLPRAGGPAPAAKRRASVATSQKARKRDGNRRAAKKFREKQKQHELTLVESIDRLEREQERALAELRIIAEIIAERE